MPIVTDLSVSPYFDDFNVDKDYYRVLFKPSTSVQVRELNQLQAILQNQIEKFGDNILRRGTVVEGVNFQFNDRVPYVKILDLEIDGASSIPTTYVGNFAKNSSNLTSIIVKSTDGFEATTPDLKTLYLHYVNSGNDSNTKQYSAGDILTIYTPSNSLSKIDIINGGSGFSNSDTVVFTPQVAVTEISGNYVVGDYIIDPLTTANLEIIEINRTALAAQNRVLIKVKPRNEDLASRDANSQFWTLESGKSVSNPAGTISATIDEIFGELADASILTEADGTIINFTMINLGRKFVYEPHVSVRSIDNEAGINALDLNARNYLAQVTVSPETGSIGFGYSFGVTTGTIYQKGHFLRVSPQSIIVSKYSTQPNNLAVGFSTREEISTYNTDTSLLDNALGTENEAAPGADRLKLIPELVLFDKDEAAANVDFFPLVEWNDGNPYKQNQATVYNRLGNEIAKTIYDSSGNFVLDTFQVTTTSVANPADEGRFYTVVVDPGQAYIGGRKVQTSANYKIDMTKGLDTAISNNIISLNYGNYIKVRELGGNFLFSTGDIVKFYDNPKGFLSNTSLIATSNTSPLGNYIGSAKMRSLTYDEGAIGTANTVYRMYIYDVKMEPGRSFDNIRSIYYDGTYKGIADTIVEYKSPPSAANGTAVTQDQRPYIQLYGNKFNKLMFTSGVESLKNSNNSTYTYRTVYTNTAFSNNGTMELSIASNPNEFFPYTGNLSNVQKLELQITPLAEDLVQYGNLPGTVSVNATSTTVSGTSTEFYDLEEGDYVQVFSNSANKAIKKVVSIVSANSITVDSVFSFANATAVIKRAFPKNVPMPFGTRDGLNANVVSNGNIMTVAINHANGTAITFSTTNTVNTAISVNVERRNITSTPKTANRKQFVKINVGSNPGGAEGPWCLGVPDIFRLRNVYVSNSSTVNTSSSDITSDFYIDHNQTSNYYGLGWLYKKPMSSLTVSSTDWFLVEFDYYTRNAEGYFDTVSYLRTANSDQITEVNSKTLSELGEESNSFEVPEVYTATGEYYDLLNQIDFRPSVANTVAPTASAATAPVNPSNNEVFDTSIDKKFPYPDSTMSTTIEQYLGRMDDVYISEEGRIYVLKGIPNVNPRLRYKSNHPKDSLKLQTLSVPAYPTLGQVLSDNVAEIIDTGIANEKNLGIRIKSRYVAPVMTTSQIQLSQPMIYTMEDIGNLERRIKDLEYYVSLSILETNITNKIIPSSNDPTINRFKFGFFADDFSTDIYSDRENPQYAASLEGEGDGLYGNFASPTEPNLPSSSSDSFVSSNTPFPTQVAQKATNRLVPPKYIWSTEHEDGGIENPPYIDQLVISQNTATSPLIPVDPCLVTINVATTNTIVSNTTVKIGKFRHYKFDDDNDNKSKKIRVNSARFRLGKVAGTASMYMYTGRGPVKVSIYQGKTLIASTEESFVNIKDLLAVDISDLSLKEYAKLWHNWGVSPSELNLYLNSKWFRSKDFDNGFVQGVFKLQWQHNPANGREYTVVVNKKFSNFRWKYLLEYQEQESVITYTEVVVNKCIVVDPPPPVYLGTMTVQGTLSWACSNRFKINLSASEYTGFVVDVTGLKPKTTHDFYIDGVKTTLVAPKPWGAITDARNSFGNYQKDLGKPLISDASGKLSFAVYVDIKNKDWLINNFGAGGSSGFTAKNDKNKSVTYGSSGYSLFEVKDTNSYAKLVTVNRSPDKVIPHDHHGNV